MKVPLSCMGPRPLWLTCCFDGRVGLTGKPCQLRLEWARLSGDLTIPAVCSLSLGLPAGRKIEIDLDSVMWGEENDFPKCRHGRFQRGTLAAAKAVPLRSC